MSDLLPGVGLVLLSACLGALAHALGKRALDGGLSTPDFLAVRSLTGATCTCLVYVALGFRYGWPAVPMAVLPLCIAVGCCHPIASNLFYFGGLKGGDLSVMSPLINTSPLFTAILAAIFLQEPQTFLSILALLVIIFGAVVVPLSGAAHTPTTGRGHSARRSALLGLSSALSIALFLVVGKRALAAADIRVVVLTLNVAACGAFASIAVVSRRQWPPQIPQAAALRRPILLTVASGILVYALCSYLSLTAVKLIGASLTSCFASTNVLFGMAFSVLLVHEKPSRERCLGAALVAIGCALSALVRSGG